ncbi:MAG: chorismate mutase [Exilispira sp.]
MLNILKREFWARGAISFNEDSIEEIEKVTLKFIYTFLSKNKIKSSNIIFLMIIAPKGLHSCYPCSFIRRNGFNFPCITVSDIEVSNSPQNILRFVIQYKSYKKIEDLYLDDAIKLKSIIDKIIDIKTL